MQALPPNSPDKQSRGLTVSAVRRPPEHPRYAACNDVTILQAWQSRRAASAAMAALNLHPRYPWTAHGAVLAAGVVHDGNGLRGVLYGRGVPGLNFDPWLPGTEPSAVNGLALDAYEQVYLIGERTLGGVRQARASRIHR